jgi:hypothetical protein
VPAVQLDGNEIAHSLMADELASAYRAVLQRECGSGV